MRCFKCGCPQPANTEAARLAAIATLNKMEEDRISLEKSLTRTVAAETPEDELRMASFEQGWSAALGLMREKIVEASKQHEKEEKAIIT